jgi:hypothetical protein
LNFIFFPKAGGERGGETIDLKTAAGRHKLKCNLKEKEKEDINQNIFFDKSGHQPKY